MSARPPDSASVTIHDVAARAGVSIKTVSRVLNHEPRVAEDTRARVQQAVAALRYTPNPAARNLSSTVSTTIGLAFNAPMDGLFATGQQYRLNIELGVLAACQDLDFGLLLLPCDVHAPQAAEQLLRRAQARRIGGLVVASPLDAAPGVVSGLQTAGLVYSGINLNDLHGGAPAVVVDDHAAAQRMVAELLARGHRRIAFIGGMASTRTAADRRSGYLAAMAGAGLTVPPDWLAEGGFLYAGGRQAAARLLALPARRRPTAVFAANDDMALGVMHEALSRGLALPRDLSVAGFDDTESARCIWPMLSTVRQPLHDMARVAVQQLAGLLYPSRRDISPQPALQVFACELMLRDSIAAPDRP